MPESEPVLVDREIDNLVAGDDLHRVMGVVFALITPLVKSENPIII